MEIRYYRLRQKNRLLFWRVTCFGVVDSNITAGNCKKNTFCIVHFFEILVIMNLLPALGAAYFALGGIGHLLASDSLYILPLTITFSPDCLNSGFIGSDGYTEVISSGYSSSTIEKVSLIPVYSIQSCNIIASTFVISI